MKWFSALVLSLCIGSASAWAASPQDVERMKQLFATHFAAPAIYQPGDCGNNIMSFINLAARSGIDLRDATIIRFKNEGDDNFGMVLAYPARNGRGPGAPGQRFWDFHVVMDYDGWVFDFDFTNGPLVLKRGQYVPMMFMPPTDDSGASENMVFPRYLVEALSAGDYQALRRNPRAPGIGWIPMTLEAYTTRAWR